MTYKKRKKNQFFPEDCVMEILLKLPMKSILRFRSVLKSWYALLISSYFINTHMKFNEKKTEFLFIYTLKHKILSCNLEDKSLVSLLDTHLKIYDLIGCCNGIICFQSDNYNIVLLNPSTREFKVLSGFRYFFDIYVRFRLRKMGFGFDDLNNDYKVILILSMYGCEIRNRFNRCEVLIYSFKSNTWGKLENINSLSTTLKDITPISSSLFFNRRVHWEAYQNYCDDDYKFSHILPMILSMDISSETFYEFQYPEAVLLWKKKNASYSNLSFHTNLKVIRGSLSIILLRRLDEHINPMFEQYIDIWSMKEYGVIETWSKQYTIGPFLSILSVLPIRENEEDEEKEDHLLLQIGIYNKRTDGCHLVRWNMSKNEEVKKYCLKGIYMNLEGLCYSQSLVSIDKLN